MSSYIVVKQPKSVGLSIVLTLFLGPIGLFYSTILGGFIMTAIPVILGAVFLLSILSSNESLFMTSFALLVLFGLFWWIVAIIWGIFSVRSYNKRLILGAMQHTYEEQIRPHNVVLEDEYQRNSASSDSNVVEWLKQNPHRGLNDYYKEAGRTPR